jgi:hypothetical protein
LIAIFAKDNYPGKILSGKVHDSKTSMGGRLVWKSGGPPQAYLG